MKSKLFRLWIIGLLFAVSASAQNHTQSVTAYQYYFDTDPGVGITGNGAIVPITPTANFNQTISIALPVLSEGLHQLYIRTVDEFGKWSIPERSMFYVQDASKLTQTVTAYQYYFDTDPGVGIAGNGAIVPITPTANFNQTIAITLPVLSEGLHQLYVRTVDEFGKWSIPERSMFYVQDASKLTQTVTAYQYYFDTDPGVGVAGNGAIVPITPSANFNQTIAIALPVLSEGLHQLYVRTLDEFGKWSVSERSTLYVQPNNTTQTVTALEYYYDNDPGVGNGISIPVTTSASINNVFSLGVSCLTAGTHYLYVRAKDEYGRWSVIEMDTLTTTAGVATPVITPAGPETICTGNSVLISSTNTAQGFTYQWLESGNDISGATNTTYSATTSGNYSLKVTCGANFSISNVVAVTVNPLTTYYANADGDAYGVTGNSQQLCTPSGIYTATVGGDCNDSNPGIYPGAPEICGNLIDDDCDNLIDEGCCNILLTETHVNVNCNGGNTGSIDLSIANTNGLVTYNWSNNATTQDISNLTSGSYTVTVTDGNNCTASLTINITQPLPFAINETHIDVLCYGNSTGSINVIPSGGTTPYTFLWNDGNTNEDRSNLAEGFYSVVATDGCGVSQSSYIYLGQNSEIFPLPDISDVMCNGEQNGSVEMDAYGGVSPYSYLWSDNSTSNIINNLAGGSYTVTITDAAGCTKSYVNEVEEPSVLQVTTTQVIHVNCNGESNGSIDINASGGVSPYEYDWIDSSTDEDRSNLTAGTYTVIVSDANGCTASVAVLITEPTSLIANCSVVQNVNCFGESNGSATVAASGGSPAYSYSWNTLPVQTNATATGLAAGIYTVTVTDSHNCTKTCSVEITEPTLLVVNCSVVQNVNCFGESNGSASVAASGGSPTYSYSWNTSPIQSNASATGLAAGVYTVTVTDAHFCTKTCSVEITQPTLLVANCSVVQNVNCFGESNGSAIVSASGGSPTYSYSWNTSPIQSNATATGLAAGVYTVAVTDAHFCTKTCSVEITQPTLLVANCSVVQNVNCYGESNGSASVTASGGSPTYSYTWNTSPIQTNATATGLSAGVYTVTVTDSHNCTKTCSVEISQPTILVANCSVVQNVNCFGESNGSASVAASGGSPAYSYSWNTLPVQTNATATGLAAGIYTVTVTDSHNCTKTCSVEITEPTILVANCSVVQNVNCFGESNGSASVVASGGSPAYSYSWNTLPVQTNATATGLSAGVYTVTVTDSHNCTKTCSVEITEPTLLVANCSVVQNVNCFGESNGSASVAASGGSPAYSYSWNTLPVQTNATATGLAAGIYTVTVTDSHNCTKTCSVEITQPTLLVANCSVVQNVNCYGGSNGSASVSASGGSPNYTYSWSTSPAQTNVTATGLTAGVYTVTVTDSHNCTKTCTVQITQPPIITINKTVVNVKCKGDNSGSITLNVSGGVANYTYLWNTGSTSSMLSNLFSGIFTVTVTDQNGCTKTNSTSITQPANGLVISISKTNVRCGGKCTGRAEANPSGGVAPYSYLWSNGKTTREISNLCALTYTVTVTDAIGCSKTKSTTVTQSPALIVIATAINSTSANASVSGGTTPYSYLWSPWPYQTTATATGLTPGGTYKVKVTDEKGCTKIAFIVMPTPKNSEFTNDENFIVFPNPTNGLITIAGFSESNATAKITLQDAAGRIITQSSQSASNGTISKDFSHLSYGVYMLTIESGDKRKTIKLILEE